MANNLNQFRNLVFEGGGVKGIAYCGALEICEKKGILNNINRVAGTSAGAITAGLLAVGFSYSEIFDLLKKTSFQSFLDNYWGYVRDVISLFKDYGWYKGEHFRNWFEEQLFQKTGNRKFSFQDLENALKDNDSNFKYLAVAGTNLRTQATEVFSPETTPNMSIAEAIRISMSIPLFFRAIKYQGIRYVDGGLYYNYPINIFDNRKYLSDPKYGQEIDYDHREGAVFNCQTLGMRVDTKDEIKVLMDQATPLPIRNIKDYMKALIGGYMDGMNKIHLHKNDWHRTIFIDSLGVKTTAFNLNDDTIDKLVESGRKSAEIYFKWFENPEEDSLPLNKPEE